MFFDSWADIGRVVAIGISGYVALLAFLRISGSRTLSKMNAFDLVVTVALGSTLATMILSSEVSFSEGAVALGLLIALQFAIAWTSVRMGAFDRLIKTEPILVVREGEILHDAARRARVTKEEIHQALRAQGFDGPGGVAALILESNGQFSVIADAQGRSPAVRPVTD